MNRRFRALVVAFGCTAIVTGFIDEAIAQTLQLPGTIQAEDFDRGAADVAYSDTTGGNAGGAYRSTNVDIEKTTDAGGGFNLGWVDAGEWLKYTRQRHGGGCLRPGGSRRRERRGRNVPHRD